MIEGSKSFAKQVMAAAGIPTAARMTCRTGAEADDGARRLRPALRGQGRRAGRGQGRGRDQPTGARPRSTPRTAARWSSRSSSTAPRCRCSRWPTAGPRCRCCRPRTTSAPTTATPARTLAAWAPTRRCPGRPGAGRRGRSPPSLQPAVAELRAPRHAVQRPAVRRALPDLARPPGGRVQRPVRRPGDAGRAGPAGHAAGRAAARPRPMVTWRRAAGQLGARRRGDGRRRRRGYPGAPVKRRRDRRHRRGRSRSRRLCPSGRDGEWRRPAR